MGEVNVKLVSNSIVPDFAHVRYQYALFVKDMSS